MKSIQGSSELTKVENGVIAQAEAKGSESWLSVKYLNEKKQDLKYACSAQKCLLCSPIMLHEK